MKGPATEGRGGYTLVEVAVATGIMAILALGMMGITRTAHEGNQLVRDETRAGSRLREVADRIMEELRASTNSHVQVEALTNGMNALTFDRLLGRVDGTAYWGVDSTLIGRIVDTGTVEDPTLTETETETSSDTDTGITEEDLVTTTTDLSGDTVTLDGKVGWKVRYLPSSRGSTDGTTVSLYRLLLDETDTVVDARIVLEDLVVHDADPGFAVASSGIGWRFDLRVWVDDDHASVRHYSFDVIPRN